MIVLVCSKERLSMTDGYRGAPQRSGREIKRADRLGTLIYR